MSYDMPMTEPGIELPRFTLRQLDMPDIIDWKVKDEKYLILKVKVVGKRSREDLDRVDRHKVEADFKVLMIKVLGDEPVNAKSLSEKHFEKVTAKALRGEG